MKCSYCKQKLNLFKSLAGSSFCSPEHQKLYEQAEASKGFERLLQFVERDAKPTSPAKPAVPPPAAPPPAANVEAKPAPPVVVPEPQTIAAKAEKESAYHLRHSAEWLIRLGDGTAESRRRAQGALENLWPYTGEMFAPDDAALVAAGTCIDPPALRDTWNATVNEVLARATMQRPRDGWMQSGGREGRHSEHLGHLLAELQYLQRAHPGGLD